MDSKYFFETSPYGSLVIMRDGFALSLLPWYINNDNNIKGFRVLLGLYPCNYDDKPLKYKEDFFIHCNNILKMIRLTKISYQYIVSFLFSQLTSNQKETDIDDIGVIIKKSIICIPSIDYEISSIIFANYIKRSPSSYIDCLVFGQKINGYLLNPSNRKLQNILKTSQSLKELTKIQLIPFKYKMVIGSNDMIHYLEKIRPFLKCDIPMII